MNINKPDKKFLANNFEIREELNSVNVKYSNGVAKQAT